MTDSGCSFDNFYPVAQIFSVPTTYTPLKFPPSGSASALFSPAAGLVDVPRQSVQRRILNQAVDKLEQSEHPGNEYAIAHLYDKYRRHLSAATLRQTGRTLLVFLSFYQGLGK
ncbi:MAG: hypothetical protein ACYC9M_06595 [Desulfobulbaceae bacterium]